MPEYFFVMYCRRGTFFSCYLERTVSVLVLRFFVRGSERISEVHLVSLDNIWVCVVSLLT